MDEDVIGEVCVEIKHHQEGVKVTSNLLWILQGVAATLECELFIISALFKDFQSYQNMLLISPCAKWRGQLRLRKKLRLRLYN